MVVFAIICIFAVPSLALSTYGAVFCGSQFATVNNKQYTGFYLRMFFVYSVFFVISSLAIKIAFDHLFASLA